MGAVNLVVEDFGAFFAAVNGDHGPFAWQRRLLEHLLTFESWPERISAPTGAGKSNVVDVHIFAAALFALGRAPRLPRRLCVVVDRRALVDSHAERAMRIATALEEAETGVLADVAAALHLLTNGSSDPVSVTQLRGGLSPQSDWLDDPRACQVICATPAMWGSRLLFRGYGTSWYARPREAASLALDAVMVLDEAHLNHQLLITARRVRDLQNTFEMEVGVPKLQVVETTATPTSAEDLSEVRVLEEDLRDDAELDNRMRRPKTLTIASSVGWSWKGAASNRHIATLVEEVLDLKQRFGGTIGCIVNRVDTAIRVTEALGKTTFTAKCWVGRQRPMDIKEIRIEHPGLLNSAEALNLDVLVATQTVEVGVDLDLAGLVTELAAGSAIAQRAGRVNRRGRMEAAEVRVVVPDGGVTTDYPPYSKEELEAANGWLKQAMLDGVSPWQLTLRPAPSSDVRRAVDMRLEWHDVERLSSTSAPLFAEEDLELWLDDELEDEQLEAGLIVRSPLPESDSLALNLLEATPPATEEAFPVAIWTLRKALDRVFAKSAGASRRAFVWRDGQWSQLGDSTSIRPGDVVCVDSGHALTRQGVVVGDDPGKIDLLETVWGKPGEVKVMHSEDDPHDFLKAVAGLEPQEAQALVDAVDPGWTVTIPQSVDGKVLPWLVLKHTDLVNEDEEVRQEWSRPDAVEEPRHPLVSLESHSEAVAVRARRIAAGVGVTPELVSAIEAAGRLHDIGKNHPGFQRMLGRRHGMPELAKGVRRSPQQARRDRASSGLPQGWRHELRSAVLAGESLVDAEDRDLVVRLVGASHGRGRGIVASLGEELLSSEDSPAIRAMAEDLFTFGEWDALVARTHESVGFWSCAYLEALVRAADCQVSKEGS